MDGTLQKQVRKNMKDKCMCGDPDCKNCFPDWLYWQDDDGDDKYEQQRAREIDEDAEDKLQKHNIGKD